MGEDDGSSGDSGTAAVADDRIIFDAIAVDRHCAVVTDSRIEAPSVDRRGLPLAQGQPFHQELSGHIRRRKRQYGIGLIPIQEGIGRIERATGATHPVPPSTLNRLAWVLA